MKAIFLLCLAVLHLSPIVHCVGTLGRTDLEQSSPNPNPGLFIDVDTPAPCTGVITEWDICYYNPRDFSFLDNLQITLQIWRFQGIFGERMSQLVETVSIPEEPERFQCISIPLEAAEYMNVTEGDVIGVSLTQNAVLPVVANFNGNSEPRPQLLFYPPELFRRSSVILTAGTFLSNQVFHVTANIDADRQVASPSTVPVQTEFLPTEVTTVTVSTGEEAQTPPLSSTENPILRENDPGRNETGSNSGAVAAIVITVLALVAVIIGIAITLTLFYLRRRRNSKDIATHPSHIPTFVIDNAVYDQPGASTIPYYGAETVIEASTYEVPVATIKRPPPSILSQPSQGMGDVASVYSTVEERSAFLDSFETTGYSTIETLDPELEKESSTSEGNPYATLMPINLDYYNTFFQQATSEISSNPYSLTTETPFLEPPSKEEEIYKQLSKKTWTIRKNEIKILKKIGEGAFSSVSKGSWTRLGQEYDVAIKALIPKSSNVDKIKLLQEAAVMGQFQHPNIVKLFGVVKKGGLPMLVTEYLSKGDLLNALHTIHPDPGQSKDTAIPSLLLSYSQQVALGMHYLSSKGFVHRDLAARNVFVSEENICKVGDFGMSRDLADTDYYVSHGGVVPVRWTAPEAIFYRKYSTTSDVWSYGCLLYEIWTLGLRPYEGIATSKYLETLQVGYRLPPPPGCPREIYSIMIKCWHPLPNDRPNFGEILTSLLQEKEAVLYIPEEDLYSHPQASLLGSNLEAGLEMYKDLQNTYLGKQKSPSPKMKRYTTIEKPRTTGNGAAKNDSEERWSKSEGQYEMEEEEDRHSSYQLA